MEYRMKNMDVIIIEVDTLIEMLQTRNIELLNFVLEGFQNKEVLAHYRREAIEHFRRQIINSQGRNKLCDLLRSCEDEKAINGIASSLSLLCMEPYQPFQAMSSTLQKLAFLLRDKEVLSQKARTLCLTAIANNINAKLERIQYFMDAGLHRCLIDEQHTEQNTRMIFKQLLILEQLTSGNAAQVNRVLKESDALNIIQRSVNSQALIRESSYCVLANIAKMGVQFADFIAEWDFVCRALANKFSSEIGNNLESLCTVFTVMARYDSYPIYELLKRIQIIRLFTPKLLYFDDNFVLFILREINNILQLGDRMLEINFNYFVQQGSECGCQALLLDLQISSSEQIRNQAAMMTTRFFA